MSSIEVVDGPAGVVVRPDEDQLKAWSQTAGDTPIATWLADLADEAAVEEASAIERSWPAIVKLRHPFDFGSDRITQLEFRRGRMDDVKGMKLGDGVPFEHLILLASRLCAQPLKVIGLLDADDAGEAMAIALGFYGKFLGAGKKRLR